MKKRLRKMIPCMLLLSCVLLIGCSKKNSKDNNSDADPLPDMSISSDADTNTDSTANTTKYQSSVKEEKKMGESRTDTVKIDSVHLSKNIIGDKSEHMIYIYLPEGYTSDGDPMPVVYFLHGLNDSAWEFTYRTKTELDKAFDGTVDEFIVVVLDGNNKTGGSFYVNSPSSGYWEDFITDEVVGYVDSHYNTLAQSDSRCITGYSMGGFGALNIGLRHPDLFSSVLAFCPGVYADGQLQAMWDSWYGWPEVKHSYAQAFSPNSDSEKDFGNIPDFSGSKEDNAILADWDSGYGCWGEKLDQYLSLDTALKCIQVNYSPTDEFAWITEGCQYFGDLMKDRNITYELNEFKGGHIVPLNSFVDYFIPFTEKYLSFY